MLSLFVWDVLHSHCTHFLNVSNSSEQSDVVAGRLMHVRTAWWQPAVAPVSCARTPVRLTSDKASACDVTALRIEHVKSQVLPQG